MLPIATFGILPNVIGPPVQLGSGKIERRSCVSFLIHTVMDKLDSADSEKKGAWKALRRT